MSKSRKAQKPKSNRGSVVKNNKRIQNNIAILNKIKYQIDN